MESKNMRGRGHILQQKNDLGDRELANQLNCAVILKLAGIPGWEG
jgi:hypothetical protein